MVAISITSIICVTLVILKLLQNIVEICLEAKEGGGLAAD